MEQNVQISNGVQHPEINPKNDLKSINSPIVINVDESGAKSDGINKIADGGGKIQNGEGEVSKDMLTVPRKEHRKSFMEVECAKERQRLSLLKQCSAILKQGEEKYTKESLHRTFQDETAAFRTPRNGRGVAGLDGVPF
ncbi:unnamed protein product [Diatraea saccharalis]|uniref:Uncharacterized protein n=1 Tax=Diatraea saccharalis TaxID=40085 RepID=A0A9N9R8A0_9NEOP|nr:unnamed protein product [Diatraea saccharalis]